MIAIDDLTASAVRSAISDAKALAVRLGDHDLANRLEYARFAVMGPAQGAHEAAMRERLNAARTPRCEGCGGELDGPGAPFPRCIPCGKWEDECSCGCVEVGTA